LLVAHAVGSAQPKRPRGPPPRWCPATRDLLLPRACPLQQSLLRPAAARARSTGTSTPVNAAACFVPAPSRFAACPCALKRRSSGRPSLPWRRGRRAALAAWPGGGFVSDLCRQRVSALALLTTREGGGGGSLVVAPLPSGGGLTLRWAGGWAEAATGSRRVGSQTIAITVGAPCVVSFSSVSWRPRYLSTCGRAFVPPRRCLNGSST